MVSKETTQMIEDLAELEHAQWSHWTKYFLDNIVDKKDGLIRLDLVQRWKRQANTHYKKLSEKEKESDREWARKVLECQYNSAKKQALKDGRIKGRFS